MEKQKAMTDAEADKILRGGISTSDPKARAMIIGTCRDIVGRIDRNMRRLKVSPYGKKFSGNLARSVYWAALTGSGGNIELAEFYVLEYGRFVEYAVQRGYKLSNGGRPSSITGVNYERIAVNRRRGNHVLKRKAAPLFFGEIILHGRMLSERLATHYGNTLGVALIHRMLPEGRTANQDILWFKHAAGYQITTDNTGINNI